MTVQVRHKTSFQAFDSEGGVHLLDVYARYHDMSTFDGRAEMEGLKEIRRRSDGSAVNFLGECRFEVVQTGEVLTTEEEPVM